MPDGLVQSRLSYFSTMLHNSVGGEGIVNVCRKRKFEVDQETAAD